MRTWDVLVFPTLVFWIETEVTVTRAGDWLTEAALTVVVAVAAFSPESGSLVAVVALAVSEIVVPPATPGATFATRVNVAGKPLASLGSVAVTVPVPPAAGVVVVQPTGAANKTNVVLAGSVS